MATQRTKARAPLTADRVARLLMPACAVFMEAFWIYPWLIFMGRWPAMNWGKPPLTFISVVLVGALSFFVTRYLSTRAKTMRGLSWGIVGIGLVAVFIVIRIEYGSGYALLGTDWFIHFDRVIMKSFSAPDAILMAMPVAAWVWWRCMLLGFSRTYRYIYNNLMFGLGSYLTLLVVWWSILGSFSLADMATAVGPYVAGFFFFGLLGTALGNLHDVEARMPPDETKRLAYRRWLPLVLGLVVVLLVIAIIVATLSSVDFLTVVKSVIAAIRHAFSGAGGFFEVLLHIILWPFQWLTVGMYYVFDWLVNLLRSKNMQIGQQTDTSNQNQPPQPSNGQPISTEVLSAMKWTFFTITVILVTMFILRSIRRERRPRRDSGGDFEESHESVWSWSVFLAGIWLFFANLWRRLWLRRALASQAGQPGAVAARARDAATALRIREVFRRLLRDGASAGVEWQRHETPFEYAVRLQKAVPETGASVDELADLYVGVRYGDEDAPPQSVARANTLWRQIRAILRHSGE